LFRVIFDVVGCFTGKALSLGTEDDVSCTFKPKEHPSRQTPELRCRIYSTTVEALLVVPPPKYRSETIDNSQGLDPIPQPQLSYVLAPQSKTLRGERRL
jgi:hypothetical protein